MRSISRWDKEVAFGVFNTNPGSFSVGRVWIDDLANSQKDLRACHHISQKRLIMNHLRNISRIQKTSQLTDDKWLVKYLTTRPALNRRVFRVVHFEAVRSFWQSFFVDFWADLRQYVSGQAIPPAFQGSLTTSPRSKESQAPEQGIMRQ
jgi:hypothetical protein